MKYFFVLCLFLTCQHGCTVDLDGEDLFKMRRVNEVWNKALKVMKGKQRSDLYADLLLQDKREKELKWKQSDGNDTDGLYEAEVRQAFADILERYDLITLFQSDRFGRPKQRDRNRSALDIRDAKLKKLMKTAGKEGFSNIEMDMLKEELHHHQLKMDEFENLKLEFDLLQDKVDNSLDNLDSQGEVWRELGEKKKDMKDAHKRLRDNYRTMEDRIKDPSNKEGRFEDERVYHLWALAQKAGMDEQELESIKTELTHFENRIRKAEYIDDRLKKTERKIHAGEDISAQEHEELKRTAQLYNRKVEKYHEDLTSRLHRRLDEL